jgi:uncharacterized protein YndB with AHSA1/START domain
MAGQTGAGPRIIGSMTPLDADTGVVRMEDRFATSVDDLWSALTEPDRIARWIGRVTGDLRLGGTVRASLTSHWEGDARIDACEPPARLVVTMRPGAPDETVFEATLTPDAGSTLLVIEERGLPLGEISAHGAGWQAHVEDLAAHIEGRRPVPWETRWHELSPAYARLAPPV